MGSVPNSAEITLTGCTQHNLCDLDLSFPAEALIFVTGPSGAGKSSLVFGTLHAESRRRYLESLSAAERSRLDQVAPPKLESADNLPLTIAIRPDTLSTGSRHTVGTQSGLWAHLQRLFASHADGFCPDCGQPVKTWQPQDILNELKPIPPGTRLQLGFPFPQDVSYQDAAAWLTAAGFRRVVLSNQVLTLEQLPQQARDPAADRVTVLVDRVKQASTPDVRLRESLETCYRAGRGKCHVFAEGAPVNPSWSARDLDGETWSQRPFTRERDCLSCGRSMLDPQPALFRWTSPLGACPTCRGRGQVKSNPSGDSGRSRIASTPCPDCEGTRLNADARGYRLRGSTLPELHALTVLQFRSWIERHLEQDLRPDDLLRPVELLCRLGLSYLPLELSTGRLSDAERISLALAGAIAEPLPGALYLIEELFSGRLAEEWAEILMLLNQLKASGAGICLIQARADVLERWDTSAPDRIIRLGPGSGDSGGRLVQAETEIEATAHSSSPKPDVTAAQSITVQNLFWPWAEQSEITLVAGGITVVTGPAQTRAAALLRDVLTPVLAGEQSQSLDAVTFDRDLPFDQIEALTLETRVPHPRKIVAASVGAFGRIRGLLTEADDAKRRNLTAKDLSLFNKRGARCVRCEGSGKIGIHLDFLPEFEMRCPECGGTRYDNRVNDVRFRGLTLPEILALTAEEAFRVFKGHHPVQRKLQLLKQVRLGYLRLGQSLTEMSRGERQRLRLAASLAKIRGARTLIVAEELSWGLATGELPSLLSVLREFTTAGHSVLLVDAHEFWEKNSDNFIKLSPLK